MNVTMAKPGCTEHSADEGRATEVKSIDINKNSWNGVIIKDGHADTRVTVHSISSLFDLSKKSLGADCEHA